MLIGPIISQKKRSFPLRILQKLWKVSVFSGFVFSISLKKNFIFAQRIYETKEGKERKWKICKHLEQFISWIILVTFFKWQFTSVCRDLITEFFLAWRKKCSINHVLIDVLEIWKNKLDDGIVRVSLMNLHEAHNCIAHCLLIAKLKTCGFSDTRKWHSFTVCSKWYVQLLIINSIFNRFTYFHSS